MWPTASSWEFAFGTSSGVHCKLPSWHHLISPHSCTRALCWELNVQKNIPFSCLLTSAEARAFWTGSGFGHSREPGWRTKCWSAWVRVLCLLSALWCVCPSLSCTRRTQESPLGIPEGSSVQFLYASICAEGKSRGGFWFSTRCIDLVNKLLNSWVLMANRAENLDS